jgi:hypothetical protein
VCDPLGKAHTRRARGRSAGVAVVTGIRGEIGPVGSLAEHQIRRHVWIDGIRERLAELQYSAIYGVSNVQVTGGVDHHGLWFAHAGRAGSRIGILTISAFVAGKVVGRSLTEHYIRRHVRGSEI